jgi:hypothetical protein
MTADEEVQAIPVCQEAVLTPAQGHRQYENDRRAGNHEAPILQYATPQWQKYRLKNFPSLSMA